MATRANNPTLTVRVDADGSQAATNLNQVSTAVAGVGQAGTQAAGALAAAGRSGAAAGDDIARAFRTLHIPSDADFARLRQAFLTIAASGRASAEEIDRAFQAYGQAAIASGSQVQAALARQVAQAHGLEGAYIRLEQSARGAGRGAANVGQAISGMGLAISAASGLVGQLGAGLLAAFAVEGLRRGIASIAEAGMKYEDMAASINFVADGAEEGARQLRALDAQAAAMKRPINELTTAYARLKNLGLDASSEAMEAFANIAAGTRGKTLIDVAEAVADAITGEWERMKEFGIRAKVEGKQVAITFRGQTQMIEGDAQSIAAALQAIGQVQFAGAVAAQAETLRTAIVRADAEAEQFLASIADTTGINAFRKNWSNAWADFFDAINRERAKQPLSEEMQRQAQAVEDLDASLRASESTFADFILASKGLETTSRRAAAATQAVADGLGETDAKAKGLTQQQRALAEQTGEFAAAAQAAAEKTQGIADGLIKVDAASKGLTEQQRILASEMNAVANAGAAETATAKGLAAAFKTLGTDAEELRTGLSANQRAMIQAFSEIATSASFSGEQIAAAFEQALAKAEEHGVVALRQAWDQALAEGQISAEQWVAGMAAVTQRLQGLTEKAASGSQKTLADSLRALDDYAKQTQQRLDEIDAIRERHGTAQADTSTADLTRAEGDAIDALRRGNADAAGKAFDEATKRFEQLAEKGKLTKTEVDVIAARLKDLGADIAKQRTESGAFLKADATLPEIDKIAKALEAIKTIVPVIDLTKVQEAIGALAGKTITIPVAFQPVNGGATSAPGTTEYIPKPGEVLRPGIDYVDLLPVDPIRDTARAAGARVP